MSELRVYVDVETTGLSRAKGAAIVEIGVVMYRDGAEVAAFASLCNPGPAALECEDADAALAVNQITREQILAAPASEKVADAVCNFIDMVAPTANVGDVKYHSFNVAFDSKFLGEKPWCFPGEDWSECVMLASQKALGLHRWPRLDYMIDHFSIPKNGSHRALVDARAAAEIHQRILKGDK